jgi:hypothetical protein
MKPYPCSTLAGKAQMVNILHHYFPVGDNVFQSMGRTSTGQLTSTIHLSGPFLCQILYGQAQAPEVPLKGSVGVRP